MESARERCRPLDAEPTALNRAARITMVSSLPIILRGDASCAIVAESEMFLVTPIDPILNFHWRNFRLWN
jgi:hypothetical protein